MTAAMQAPERVKLASAGTLLYMIVQSAELVPVGKYPEYSFIGQIDNGRVVDLRVPQKSADRQLERLNLELAETVGARLLFSRGENPNDASKPYWNIDVVSDSGAKQDAGRGGAAGAAPAGPGTLPTNTTTPTTPTPAPENPITARREKRSAVYLAQTKWVLDTIVPLYEGKKILVNANDVHAMVAVLFIAETRN